MLRPTLTLATSIKAKPLLPSTTRLLSTAPEPQTKARTEQMVEQARSTLTPAYKTIKEKQDPDQDTIRCAQIVWLAQKSHADGGVAKELPSPHTQPWGPLPMQKGQEDRCDNSGEMSITTIWPHLW